MITRRETKKSCLVVVCACAIWTCGCYTRTPAAKPVVNFVAVRPVLPQGGKTDMEDPPDVPSETLAELPDIGVAHPQPAKPHIAPPPAPDSTGTPKHAETTIAPEVPTEEMRAAQEETQRNLDVAERNLMMAQGRVLNATQKDLASKVRGFADNAREAMRAGDWVKAKNFSNKAQVLSEQLAGSL